MNALIIIMNPGIADGPRVLVVPMCRNGHVNPPYSQSGKYGRCMVCARESEHRRYMKNIDVERAKDREYRRRLRRESGAPERIAGDGVRCGHGHLYAEVGKTKRGVCKECARVSARAAWRRKHGYTPPVWTGPCHYCNWSRHDLSIHSDFCRNGHPREIVGRDPHGRCRECQRQASKRSSKRLESGEPTLGGNDETHCRDGSAIATGVPFRVEQLNSPTSVGYRHA